MRGFLQRHFGRVTTSGRFIPEIDGMRFVAIALVLVHHVWSIWSLKNGRFATPAAHELPGDRVFEFCAIGVQLFFMISGFILALPFLEAIDHRGPPVGLRQYFWRRVTRLEPPYVVSMLLFFGLGIALGRFNWSEHWGNLAASLLYLHNVAYGAGSLINNNAWSLEIEVQFYVLVPVLVWLFRARVLVRRLLLVAAVLAGSWLSVGLPPGFPKTLLSAAHYFLAGFLLCDLYLSFLRDREVRSWWADAAGVLAWVAIGLVGCLPALHGVREFALPFLFLAYGAALFASRGLRVWHRLPLLTAIGGMCYSIYLLHARLLSLLMEAGFSRLAVFESVAANVAILTVVLVPPVLAGSAVFFLLIERPCMRRTWPQDLWRWIRGGRATREVTAEIAAASPARKSIPRVTR